MSNRIGSKEAVTIIATIDGFTPVTDSRRINTIDDIEMIVATILDSDSHLDLTCIQSGQTDIIIEWTDTGTVILKPDIPIIAVDFSTVLDTADDLT